MRSRPRDPGSRRGRDRGRSAVRPGADNGSGARRVSPILVNDNVFDILAEPAAKPGEPAEVKSSPKTAFATMDAQVTTVAADQPVELTVRSVGPRRLHGTRELAGRVIPASSRSTRSRSRPRSASPSDRGDATARHPGRRHAPGRELDRELAGFG